MPCPGLPFSSEIPVDSESVSREEFKARVLELLNPRLAAAWLRRFRNGAQLLPELQDLLWAEYMTCELAKTAEEKPDLDSICRSAGQATQGYIQVFISKMNYIARRPQELPVPSFDGPPTRLLGLIPFYALPVAGTVIEIGYHSDQQLLPLVLGTYARLSESEGAARAWLARMACSESVREGAYWFSPTAHP